MSVLVYRSRATRPGRNEMSPCLSNGACCVQWCADSCFACYFSEDLKSSSPYVDVSSGELVRTRATTAVNAPRSFLFLRFETPEHTNKPPCALKGLSKPSDSSPPIAFPSSELDKLRDLPVWKTLSGKRVAVDRNRHFSLAEGGDVADLPLPPGASDR